MACVSIGRAWKKPTAPEAEHEVGAIEEDVGRGDDRHGHRLAFLVVERLELAFGHIADFGHVLDRGEIALKILAPVVIVPNDVALVGRSGAQHLGDIRQVDQIGILGLAIL